MLSGQKRTDTAVFSAASSQSVGCTSLTSSSRQQKQQQTSKARRLTERSMTTTLMPLSTAASSSSSHVSLAHLGGGSAGGAAENQVMTSSSRKRGGSKATADEKSLLQIMQDILNANGSKTPTGSERDFKTTEQTTAVQGRCGTPRYEKTDPKAVRKCGLTSDSGKRSAINSASYIRAGTALGGDDIKSGKENSSLPSITTCQKGASNVKVCIAS